MNILLMDIERPSNLLMRNKIIPLSYENYPKTIKDHHQEFERPQTIS
jgi:hypothetical protein